jgi:hypothetical protein
MPKSTPKPKPKATAKPERHDPTPEERNERHKIEGHTFEQAMGVILKAPRKPSDGGTETEH